MGMIDELRIGETIIVAGNGPSISNVPDEFLKKYPLFCVNRWPSAHHLGATYWTAWDTWSLVENLPMAQSKNMTVFLNKRIWEYYRNTFDIRDDSIVWYTTTGPIGVPVNPKTGAVFIGTTHAAVWLSYLMGYKKILLVGFNCTIGIDPIHNNPHFYDEDKLAVYAEDWDMQMAAIATWLDDNDVDLVNLTDPTESKLIRQGNIDDYR